MLVYEEFSRLDAGLVKAMGDLCRRKVSGLPRRGEGHGFGRLAAGGGQIEECPLVLGASRVGKAKQACLRHTLEIATDRSVNVEPVFEVTFHSIVVRGATKFSSAGHCLVSWLSAEVDADAMGSSGLLMGKAGLDVNMFLKVGLMVFRTHSAIVEP